MTATGSSAASPTAVSPSGASSPAAASGARLEVNGLSVRFGGNWALREVSLVAEPGQVHAVIGPNGAGKSTLFNVLSGVCRPSEGSVLLDQRPILGLAPHRIARLGVGRAFQNGSMIDDLTVAENLLLGRHHLLHAGVLGQGLRLPRARAEERDARERIVHMADFLDVRDVLDRPAGELPYGTAKRVDIGRALAGEPRLLLLDEPAAGTHAYEKTLMAQVIRRITAELGTTVVLVEHDMDLVMGVSDAVTVLNFGTVLADGPPAKVRADPAVLAAYLGTAGAPRSAAPPAPKAPHGQVEAGEPCTKP